MRQRISACAASTIAGLPSPPGRRRRHPTPDEFVRRFLLHVLPRGFVKIPHFGLLAPANVNGKLALARHRLAPAPDPRAPLAAAPAIAALVTLAAKTGQSPPAPAWRDLFHQITGIDLGRCRVCGQGNVVRFPLPPPPASSPVILDTS